MDVVPRFAFGQIIEIRDISLAGPMLTTVGCIAACVVVRMIRTLKGAANDDPPPDPARRPPGPTLFRTACYATRDTERQRRPDPQCTANPIE